jgi:hypothetical protein
MAGRPEMQRHTTGDLIRCTQVCRPLPQVGIAAGSGALAISIAMAVLLIVRCLRKRGGAQPEPAGAAHAAPQAQPYGQFPPSGGYPQVSPEPTQEMPPKPYCCATSPPIGTVPSIWRLPSGEP